NDVAARRFERARLVGHRDGGGRLDALQRVGKQGHCGISVSPFGDGSYLKVPGWNGKTERLIRRIKPVDDWSRTTAGSGVPAGPAATERSRQIAPSVPGPCPRCSRGRPG